MLLDNPMTMFLNHGSQFLLRHRLPLFFGCVCALLLLSSLVVGCKGLSKPESLTLRNVNIVDDSGKIRMTLSAQQGAPQIRLLGIDGKEKVAISLKASGFGSIKLTNPEAANPVASFEIGDKGAHVKFDRPGGASSYLFLNNKGESGTVYIDASGRRRMDLLVTAEGQSMFHRYDQQSTDTR